MNKKVIPIILVSLSCLLFIVAIVLLLNTNYFEFNNKTDNKKTNNNSIIYDDENDDKVMDTNNSINESVNNKEELNNQSSSNQSNNNQEITDDKIIETEKNPDLSFSVDKNDIENQEDEIAVINYFALEDNNITRVNQDDRTLREKAKNTFVTIVDFIFYDKEIKGYTFNELTTSAKLKIIKIALSIDNKIDEYFPDYKEVIKDKYDNIKGKLVVKYLEFTSSLCETVGEDTCNQAKEDFNSMKENFNITWQLIKELAANGSNKVKEFYESWRDTK